MNEKLRADFRVRLARLRNTLKQSARAWAASGRQVRGAPSRHGSFNQRVDDQNGRWLNADPFAGKVAEQPLAAYLEQHGYSGIYVTRMKNGPKPARCR